MTGRRGLGQTLAAPIAVVADRRLAHQHLGTLILGQRGETGDELAGALDPGVVDALPGLRGPPLIDRLADQMHDRVDTQRV
jgi:hypothetical protein